MKATASQADAKGILLARRQIQSTYIKRQVKVSMGNLVFFQLSLFKNK